VEELPLLLCASVSLWLFLGVRNVLIIDDLILGGFNFVLKRLADAVDAELTDDRVYREELLAAQMRLELGEITETEFADIERDLLAKIREVKERQGVAAPAAGTYKVEEVEISADLEAPTRSRPK
jgi:hypothetical protein